MTYEDVMKKLPQQDVDKVDENLLNGIKLYLSFNLVSNLFYQTIQTYDHLSSGILSRQLICIFYWLFSFVQIYIDRRDFTYVKYYLISILVRNTIPYADFEDRKKRLTSVDAFFQLNISILNIVILLMCCIILFKTKQLIIIYSSTLSILIYGINYFLWSEETNK